MNAGFLPPPTDPVAAEIDLLLQGPDGGLVEDMAPQGAPPPQPQQQQQVTLMRDQQGVIAGARIGDRVVKFQRGPDQRIVGFVIISQPQM